MAIVCRKDGVSMIECRARPRGLVLGSAQKAVTGSERKLNVYSKEQRIATTDTQRATGQHSLKEAWAWAER
jgi:hypothetical protein